MRCFVAPMINELPQPLGEQGQYREHGPALNDDIEEVRLAGEPPLRNQEVAR